MCTMTKKMSQIYLILAITSLTTSVSSLTEVQISTCDAPIRNEPASFCCFTSNLPVGASIYFSKNANHVVRISESCKQLWVSDNLTYSFNWTCSSTGSLTDYSILLSSTYSETDIGDVWECGFYGNKSKLVVMEGQILDDNTYIQQTPGNNASLSFTLPAATQASTLPAANQVPLFRLYKLDNPDQTLLKVNTNNTAEIYAALLHYIGDIKHNFSVVITNVKYSYNGTYVFEKHASNAEVTRSGFTLVVNKEPSMPTINASSDWKLSGNKASGSVACVSYSQSAAPLYYKPDVVIKWRLPGQNDWSPGLAHYSVVTYSKRALISGVDCTTPTLPIYCSAIDGTLMSDSSESFDPRLMCDVLGFNKPFEGDPNYRALVIVICVFVTTTVFIFVITTVVARHFLKRKLKRFGKKCRSCCTCCAELMPSSSGSDSDSDYREGLRRSRRRPSNRTESLDSDLGIHHIRRRDRRPDFLNLADGLNSTSRDSTMERALEQIAIEESRNMQQNHTINSDGNLDGQVAASLGVQGAEGGVGISNRGVDTETRQLIEVETLLDNHHKHLKQDTVQLRVHRDNIVDNLLNYYADENVAKSRVNVKMVGEEGVDYGGVAYDMYTAFWNRLLEDQFFLGSDRVVPHLLPHKLAEENKYRVFGRILSHSVAVLKAFPLPMCKSTVIAMIFETTEVSPEVLIEDFLYFLDEVDRSLVTAAMNEFSSLTDQQKNELGTIFERYDYAVIVSRENFHQHLLQLARHTLCIKPKQLLDKMRSGIPQSHLEHFWSSLHQDALNILYRVLQPTPERIIARLKTDEPLTSGKQTKVLGYLKDFLKEMSQVELETFLVFVTGKKSMPRQHITICFTKDRGNLRTPKAHTCSTMMEVPETYETYDTFRSEFKHLLASDEALRMTMA